MVKVVLDTNIWISAIFFGGKLIKILEYWKKEKFTLFFSPETFSELKNKLLFWGKKLKAEEKAKEYLYLINKKAEFVYPQKKFSLCDDPTDNKFLDLAWKTKADYLVSRDKKVLKVGKIDKTKIISPRKFLTTKFS